jgi:predicted secreted protein
MSSKSFRPQGLLLQQDNPAGSNAGFTTIAEVKKVDFTGGKADTADVTNMDSTGAYREFLPTLLDAGELSFDGNYLGNVDTTQAELQSTFDSQVLSNWKIVLPTPPGELTSRGTWTFKAYVTSFDPQFPTDKEASFTAKLKITGPRTFTP